MIKTILCAVDINRPGAETKVLQTAQRLAEAEGAQLDVITVIPDFGMSVVGGFFKESHQKTALSHARELLAKMVGEALGEDANKAVRHVVGVGNAYHEILEMAEKDGADLIVLGAHRPDLKDYLLGPNAARVVRHAKISVYVVR
ncbi:universal stress protein [Pseudothioclava nitratireducens]|jgi:nucleotide-binding universal stress UspA family protein|uniref:universal stress protein n=1 Tax=Pseudothioclava nitratireducens TaxID=1928646 RepID=UPI0023DBC5DD|nr:universal stress protein [Defluviimonas nitratireducens]MDF1620486.1 universal stress protein [Defluviimonas nitratireducens]